MASGASLKVGERIHQVVFTRGSHRWYSPVGGKEKKMVRCKVCGKILKDKNALGGHMSSAHPRGKQEVKPVDGDPKEMVAVIPKETPQTQLAPSGEDDPGVMERIRILMGQNYTPRQIKDTFGYAPRTVDQVAAEFIKPEGLPQVEEEAAEAGLPIKLKDGKGEILSPEAVYYRLVASDGIDGERDFRALMRWAASIEMVQRMTQIRKGEAEAFTEMTKPMLDMMEKSREELDAAAARARESSMAIAEAAAAGAAARATMRIDERFNEFKQQKADIATVQDPMKGLMARTMEGIMQRIQGMMFGGQGGGQVGPTPGLVDKRGQGG
jgi:hypothetical protein